MHNSLSSPVKAVLFDWDNTLVDTGLSIFEAINMVLSHFGKQPLLLQEFLQQPSISTHAYFSHLLPYPQSIEAEDLYMHHLRLHKTLTPLPHSERLLQWLNKKGIPKAVVSNKEGNLLRQEISDLKWDIYFNVAVGAYDTSHDKPSPVPLLYALSCLSLDAGADIWFVGDSSVDMECAQRALCCPVSLGPQADLHSGPLIKAKNCRSLLNILKKISLKLDENPK